MLLRVEPYRNAENIVTLSSKTSPTAYRYLAELVGRGSCAARGIGPSLVLIALSLVAATSSVELRASDHLDSPASVANPASDIADVYAWTSPDGRRLNLAMTVQGHAFSDRIDYALHVDSGRAFGRTTASTRISCHFASGAAVRCELGDADSAAGDPTDLAGIESLHHRFRVYAGKRDDPFYNNIKGLLAAYQVARDAIAKGAAVDSAGCANLDPTTALAVREQMGHTDGGAAQNLLRNWTVSAIVVSVDLDAVTQGGPLLAVWGTTSVAGRQLDRMARPFVGNTLLGDAPFSGDDPSGARRQEYNELLSSDGKQFLGDLEKSLAFQDSLDGRCGNQLLAESHESPRRYEALAQLFADDRLWVNSASNLCTHFFAVELASAAGREKLRGDCGGRAPTYDTSNVWRSLLIAGTSEGITDGLQEDEHPPSATVFPFLAAPDAQGVDH
jgi:hypothetical protein